MGGAEAMLVDIINEQVKTEKVALLVINETLNNSLIEKIDIKCEICLIKRKAGSKSFLPWIKLNLFLYRYSPSVIHFHLEGIIHLVFHDAPKVFTIHNLHTSGKEYSHFKALYSISSSVADHTRVQGYKSTIIWNGIHPNLIKPKSNSFYDNKKPCHIICVGRLYMPHKGQDLLLKALCELKKLSVDNVYVDFLGDGESKDEIIRMVTKMELSDKVSILGSRSRNYIYQHLCDYDLFVLPSRSEGFGLSVVEAMCAKIPVLVSDINGPMEVINGGKYGMFFKSDDYISLSRQIRKFIINGCDMDIIEQAYYYARNNFDVSVTSRKYIKEYKKILT